MFKIPLTLRRYQVMKNEMSILTKIMRNSAKARTIPCRMAQTMV